MAEAFSHSTFNGCGTYILPTQSAQARLGSSSIGFIHSASFTAASNAAVSLVRKLGTQLGLIPKVVRNPRHWCNSRKMSLRKV